ncbi:hypothetical protein SDC9_193853 [bioreactor metagenome]|uniref:Uncharacterized protein n=1 Tax=bioreactor metagenome TaxID=1076179 RepID=A0A645I4S9_9ZZZZ
MGDQDDRRAHFALQLFHQIQHLRLNGHIQRCRGLICNQQLRLCRKRHRNHHALTHAAGKLVRIFVHTLVRGWDTHFFQHFCRLLPGLFFADFAVCLVHLHQLHPNAVSGVQGGHRLLKDHGYFTAAHLAHFFFTQRHKVAPLKTNAATGNKAGLFGQQT